MLFFLKLKTGYDMRISYWSSDCCSSDLATIPAHRPQDHITLEMAPLEIRHRSVRPISAKHAQASRFLQQSPASVALHHKLCHTLGGTFDMPHAQTHTAVLPHAIAYNAPSVPEAMERA